MSSIVAQELQFVCVCFFGNCKETRRFYHIESMIHIQMLKWENPTESEMSNGVTC